MRAPETRVPLTQLGDVRLSLCPWSVRLGRRLPRAARCLARSPQLEITGTTTSTWSPNSLKSTSSRQLLICIPEVATRSPVRAFLRPLSPRSSPAGRCRRVTGGIREAPRGRVGVAGGVSPGEAAEPWLSSDFSSSTFRAALTSAIPAFPSLLAPGLLTVPFPPGTGFLDLLGGLLRSRSPLLPSSQGLPFDRSPSGLKNSQQLRPAALPLQPGADDSARQLRLPRWRRRRSSPRWPPSLYYQAAHYHRGRAL